MKLVALAALLGVALVSNAHADGQSNVAVSPQKSLDKQAASSAKKPKALRNKKAAAKRKAAPQTQEGVMTSPSESAEQSVQLRGVRG